LGRIAPTEVIPNEPHQDASTPPGFDLRSDPDRTPVADDSILTSGEATLLRGCLDAIHSTDFVERWISYGSSRTDAPPDFHHMAASVLIAAAIDRNRWLALRHKIVYPSLYILNLAASGQRKSTPLNYAESAAMSVLKDRLLAADYSPEAFIEELAHRSPSRGVAFIDEAGRLFSTMRTRAYGEGLKDLLSRAWDSPDEYSRKLRGKKGRFTWRSVYVNLIMATTPTRLAETLTPDDISSGFLPRFLPALVTEPIARKPLGPLTKDIEGVARQLVQDLTQMRAQLLSEPAAMPITEEAIGRLDQLEQALEAWATSQFHADLILPWARRLGEYAARLAVIFAISEGVPEAGRLEVLRAVSVVDRARNDIRTVVDDLLKDQQARQVDKVARFIEANPGITSRELQRRTSLRKKQIDEVTGELRAQGRVYSKATRGGLAFYPVVGTDS
jgi:hypothetical protein